MSISKCDNPTSAPSYEYNHRVMVTGKPNDAATVKITSTDHLDAEMTPDSALALAKALRDAAIKALSLRKGDTYSGGY